MTLAADHIIAGYGRRTVLHDLTLTIAPASIVGILGPNGCGKSTLVNTLARVIKPRAGRVTLDGRALPDWSPNQLARQLAILPQSPQSPPGMTVLDLVRLGRRPHVRFGRPLNQHDRDTLDRIIHQCDLHDLLPRTLTTLSGGERQRAFLGMALAQEPRVLLLDEPTAALDVGHQLELLGRLHALNRRHRLTLVMVLHDINLALRFCDRLVVMSDGRIEHDTAAPRGEPLTAAISRVFRVHATHRDDPFCEHQLAFDRAATFD